MFKKVLYYTGTIVVEILLIAVQLPELKEKLCFKLETFFPTDFAYNTKFASPPKLKNFT